MGGTARKRARRAETFAVRRWLQIGAASAGMSAALFGLVGTQPAVALADDTSGASTSSDAGDSDNADSPGPGAGAGESGTGNDSVADDDAPAEDEQPDDDEPDDDAPGDDEQADDDEAIDDEQADDRDSREPQSGDDTTVSQPIVETVTPASQSDNAQNDAFARSERVTQQDEPETAAVTADTETAAAAETHTAAATADVDLGEAPVAAAASAAPTIAPAAVAAPRNLGELIAFAIESWTAASQGWIQSLPLDPGTKANLVGALWLVRRTFLNRAPSMAPVQLTGQLTGPITGRLDAVDPENDPLVYLVTRAPSAGSLQLNPDGTYAYTPGDGFTGVDSFGVVALDPGFHMNVLDLFRPWGASAQPLINQGAIKFAFNYTSGAEHWTDERKAALQRAANDLIVYFVVAAPVVLTYDVTGLDDEASSTLASAGSGLISGSPGFWRTVVQNKLLSGLDANGTSADGIINWNFGSPWGLGDTVGDDEFDFTSTAMHELLHSFGFISYVDAAGDNDETARTIFDSLLVAADGRRPIRADFTWDTAYDPNLTGGNGGLYLGGSNAVAAYGGFVPIFTPNPWEQGSSGSHLDDTTFTGANEQMMNAKTDTGPGVRTLSAIEIGILRDLGYTVPNAPAYSAALIGLLFVRRRRSGSTAKAR